MTLKNVKIFLYLKNTYQFGNFENLKANQKYKNLSGHPKVSFNYSFFVISILILLSLLVSTHDWSKMGRIEKDCTQIYGRGFLYDVFNYFFIHTEIFWYN